jgi:hypothetical protein
MNNTINRKDIKQSSTALQYKTQRSNVVQTNELQARAQQTEKLLLLCKAMVTGWALLMLMAMLLSAPLVKADCVADIDASGASKSYAEAVQLESAGKLWEAINLYTYAQGYVCDKGGNPVAQQALAKAITLGTQQGKKAEQSANFFNEGRNKGAFQWYEKGAQFTAADKALMAALERSPNSFEVVSVAIEHFYQRGQAYFAANNRAAISAAGGYELNGRYATYVDSLPAMNVERILNSYSSVLPDAYLKSLVSLEFKKETIVPGDMNAMLQVQQESSAMQQHWQSDRLADAQALFEEAQRWARLLRNNQAIDQQLDKIARAQLAHADRLAAHYSSSYSVLETALDVYRELDKKTQIKQVQQQARNYADKALAAKQFDRSSNFYGLAGDEKKAQQVREQQDAQNEALRESLQADAGAQVAAMQAIYSDPEKLKELQRQAKLLQEQMRQSTNKESYQQEQSQLESDLGL